MQSKMAKHPTITSTKLTNTKVGRGRFVRLHANGPIYWKLLPELAYGSDGFLQKRAIESLTAQISTGREI